MINDLGRLTCAHVLINLFILLVQIVTCGTMQETCQTDRSFQKISDILTVDTEQAYELLLQRRCQIDDSIQRYFFLTILLVFFFLNSFFIVFLVFFIYKVHIHS